MNDVRGESRSLEFGDARDERSTYVFPGHLTRESWEARAEHLRRRILVSAGLWPLPDRTSLHACVTGSVEHEDYAVRNVALESYPGFFVFGNLYCPRGKTGPFPGVLNPQGHWEHGRLDNSESGSIVARCITLARQGYVAFAYDMVGLNEGSLQVPVAGHGKAKPSVFRDLRGYLWGISLMGLQLWNSIRATDYICSLPEVDPARIACTGASGGGTQTFMLAAVDRRITAAAPVNMVSASFQGGCLCENAPNLRLECSNVEFAAMMAPRPMLMVACTGDWTRDTPRCEYPAVCSIYRLYEASRQVEMVQIDAPHNYNKESREAVYHWLGRLMLGAKDAEALKERTIEPDPPESLLVFRDGKLPAHAVTVEQLKEDRIAAARSQIEALAPVDAATLHAYREVMGVAYRYALTARQPESCELRASRIGEGRLGGYRIERLIVGRREGSEHVPATLYVPEPPAGGVLAVHPAGQAGLLAGQAPSPLLDALLRHHLMVLAIDACGAGSSAGPGPDYAADHYLTYNRSAVARGVQDILTAIAYLRTRAYRVSLLGLEEAGLWCLLAAPLATGLLKTVADAAQFDPDDDNAWIRRLFVPQIRRAGDLRTVAALVAPSQLVIHNAAATFPVAWFEQTYAAAGVPEAVHIVPTAMDSEETVRALLAGVDMRC